MIVGPWPIIVIVVPLTNSVLTIDPSAIEMVHKIILEFNLQLCTPLAALKPVSFTRWLESSR